MTTVNVQIKVALGKLAARAGLLPAIHGDPWDRLLIAQAQHEGIGIVTADPLIAQYDVETIW